MQTKLLLTVAAIGFVSACGSKKNAATIDASNPAAVISQIDGAVVSAASGLGSSSLMVMSTNPRIQESADTSCTQYAEPTDGTGTDSSKKLSQSSPIFAERGFFCRFMKNTGSPDSIRGSYTMIQSLSCALHNAGVTFDGAAHNVTISIDTACFTSDQISSMTSGGTTSMAISVTGSSPAASNSHYSHGIVMTIPDFGTFTLLTNVSGSTAEFVAMEDQTGSHPGKTGAYAASYDSSSGLLQFEARHDRFNCSENGSCGWSRHDRFKATVSGTEVSDVKGIHSETYAASMGDSGWVSSIAGGSGATGFQARLYVRSGASNLSNAAGWTEVTQTSSGSATALTMPSSGSFPFSLVSGHTSSAAWLAGLTSGLSLSDTSFSSFAD